MTIREDTIASFKLLALIIILALLGEYLAS
jgi:hypothetical protein